MRGTSASAQSSFLVCSLAQSRGESAAAVVVARRGKSASAHSSSVQRRAISRRLRTHELLVMRRVACRSWSATPGGRECLWRRAILGACYEVLVQAWRPRLAIRRVWFSTSLENIRLIAARSIPGRSTVPVRSWVKASRSAATR
jgi:hypothetical protein